MAWPEAAAESTNGPRHGPGRGRGRGPRVLRPGHAVGDSAPLGQCVEDRAGEASSSPPCSRPCVLRNACARHAGVGPLKRRWPAPHPSQFTGQCNQAPL